MLIKDEGVYMIKILKLKGQRRQTHVLQNKIKKSNVKTLCGYIIKKRNIVSIKEGNVELVTCSKCLTILSNNVEFFLK